MMNNQSRATLGHLNGSSCDNRKIPRWPVPGYPAACTRWLVVVLTWIPFACVQAQSGIADHSPSVIANLATGIFETIIYSTIGIIMAVIGFKVVDWLTPGNLAEEVAHKENRALAILAGSMMLGVCLIIASVLVD